MAVKRVKIEVEMDLAYNEDEMTVTPEIIKNDITIVEHPRMDGFILTRKGNLGDPSGITLFEDARITAITPVKDESNDDA